MHKKLLIFLSIPLLLTSCGNDDNSNSTTKDNIKASVSQTAKIEAIIPKTTNKDKEDNKNLIVNNKLNKEDKEKLENIKKKNNDDFYLFENKSNTSLLTTLYSDLALLERDIVYVTNPSTGNDYTTEEYISFRNTPIDFIDPVTEETSKVKTIDKEIYLLKEAKNNINTLERNNLLKEKAAIDS